MALLKQPALQTTTFRFADVEAEAAALLSKARAEAADIVAAARADAETIRRDAEAVGRAAGHDAGLAEGRDEGVELGREEAREQHGDELNQLAETLAALLAEFEAHRHALKDNVAADVTRLALAVAEKITKRQGTIDPQVLADNLAATARLVADGHDVRISIHPDQEQTLHDMLPRLSVEWPSLSHAAIVTDDMLSPGGVRLSSVAGSIDADLATQLEHLAAELLPEG